MTTRSLPLTRWERKMYVTIAAFLRGITRPSQKVEPKLRRRIQLLAGFQLLMTVNTLIGSIILKHIGGNIWMAMAASSAIFLVSYFISRTRYHRVALILTLAIPALPPISMAILKPPEINLTAELMWLSLPLLMASVLLTVRQTVILSASYILCVVVLDFAGLLDYKILAPLMAYMLIITLIIIAIATLRKADESETNNQLTERIKTEKTLRESEEKFSKAFNASPQQIVITRARDNITLDVNDSYLRTSGFTRQEVIGQTADALGVWESPEANERFMRMLAEKGRISNEEFNFRNKAGVLKTALVSIESINLHGEECWISVIVDISERKMMEQALRDSEEKFSKAFQAIPEALAIVTLKDQRFIDVNDSFLMFHHQTREQIIGHRTEDMNLWTEPSQREKMVALIRNQGHFENLEYEFRAGARETRTALISADIISLRGEPCMLIVANDITERKRMEQALRDSEEKFSAAFRSSPNPMLIASLDEDKFIEVNESFEHFVGYSRQEIIGHNSKDLKLFASEEDFMRMSTHLFEKGKIYNEEYRSIRKSGEERIGLFSVETITITGKLCMIMAITDITEQKVAEEKLKLTMTELQRSSARLEATNKELESFSYSVSHDLRSPLRSIDGFSQALLEDYAAKLDDTGKDYLNRLRGASQKMGELIDGLLKLSRLTRSEMHPEKVDLSALAQDISARLQETQPKKHAEFVIDPGLIANADPQMARVLLENLLGNAWKFTGKTPHARIEFGKTGNGVATFYIKDNGAGFDMAYKDKIFNAFQRLHNTADFPGTGIGLATVQRIINRHGGSIRAEGAVGQGATFYFTLS